MYFSRNNKYTHLLKLLVLVFAFSSCVSGEDERSTPAPVDNSKAQILLQMPTSTYGLTDAEDPESHISNISLFVFDSATGAKEHYIRLNIPYTGASTDVDMSRWADDQIIMLLNANILSNLNKTRNIHIVANIGENKVSPVANETALKTVLTDAITAEIPAPTTSRPIVMHGVKNNHNFSTDIRASISLVRNVAKVSMTINTQKFTFGGKNITLAPSGNTISTKMGALSDRSYVIPNTVCPATTAYFSCGNKTVTPTQEALEKTKSSVTYYINENLRASYDIEANATYAIIQIPYRVEGDASVKTDNYYKVLINSDNSYKINRNTIYNITLDITSLGGETDASALLVQGTLNILPWNENTIVSDISQTYLTVKETITKIAATSNFYYATNAVAADCSVASNATWLTASFDVANNIKLTASGADYTAPRTTTLNIKTKNLTKTITVIQEPKPIVTGSESIKLNPRVIYISEAPNYKDVYLTITPTTATSLRIDGNTSIASCNHVTGAGNKTVRFTRGGTYGDSYFKFANRQTMEYDSVRVCNLNLVVPATIEIGGQAATTDFDELYAYGGDANWVVKSVSASWMTVTKVDDKLRIAAQAGPDEQKRYGTITVAHVNDANYTKVINVTQMDHVIVTIPEFEYLVFKYDWVGTGGQDLDTATEFINTGLRYVDYRPFGFGLYGTVDGAIGPPATAGHPVNLNTKGDQTEGGQLTNPSGASILVWGGDNTNQNAGESLYLDVKNLCSEEYFDALPRKIYIDLYAIWWTTQSSTPINVIMTAYKGGTMVRYPENPSTSPLRKNFYNEGGETVYSNKDEPAKRVISIKAPSQYLSYKTKFIKVGRVTFDKIKREASIEIYNTRSVQSSITTPFEPFANESKDEYSERLQKYYMNNKK